MNKSNDMKMPTLKHEQDNKQKNRVKKPQQVQKLQQQQHQQQHQQQDKRQSLIQTLQVSDEEKKCDDYEDQDQIRNHLRQQEQHLQQQTTRIPTNALPMVKSVHVTEQFQGTHIPGSSLHSLDHIKSTNTTYSTSESVSSPQKKKDILMPDRNHNAVNNNCHHNSSLVLSSSSNTLKTQEYESATNNASIPIDNFSSSVNNSSIIKHDVKMHVRPSESSLLSSKKVHQNEPKKSVSFFRVRFGLLFLGLLLRTATLDIPLLMLFGVVLASKYILLVTDTYLMQQLELQKFTSQKARASLTYYHHVCTAEQTPTANDTDAFLVVNTGKQNPSAKEIMLKHGLAIYPNLLSQSTATDLRNFILEENERTKELIYVIDNKNRWSFPIQVDQHPSVTQALHELLNNNPALIEGLESIMGKNPAIIEFTAITAAPGAKAQFWHQDVVPATSGAKYGRAFIPSYSLFIPLQNTTSTMGATGVCPGTHMCAEGASQYCKDLGFQTSGRENNWPMGYGALVNQQTTHRGEAHSDHSASHRVVFILTFAPRPLGILPNTVETRLIGQAGSYSLHWSHWGHTLYDFQQPLVRMKHPYRILRSMGLYNPYGSDSWGWDYVTVSSGRIAASDTGFTSGDLDEFIEKNGGFKFLPQSWHATVVSLAEGERYQRNPWIDYLIQTVQNIHIKTKELHNLFIWIYIISILSWNVLLQIWFMLSSHYQGQRPRHDDHNRNGTIRSNRRNVKFFISNVVWMIVRLILIHGCISILSHYWWWRVSHSTWAKNIQGKRSFTVLPLPKGITTTPNSLPNQKVLQLQATIPNDHDIFIFDNMKSTYMHSYNDVLDAFHPGNRVWNEELIQKYSCGYMNLPLPIQEQLRHTLIRWAKVQYKARILIQTHNADWSVADESVADSFCHKSLILHSSSHTCSVNTRRTGNDAAILQQLEYSTSELKFGYYRNTALHKRKYLIPMLLQELQHKVIGLSKIKNQGRNQQQQEQLQRQQFLLQMRLDRNDHQQRSVSIHAATTLLRTSFNNAPKKLQQRTSSLTEKIQSTEPFQGAWIRAGDIIEAAYKGDKHEWYAATVTGANADKRKWEIEYADGEVDATVCYTCIRPFVPYRIGERIEARLDSKLDGPTYFPGVVIAKTLSENNLYMYTIQLDNGSTISDTPMSELRRVSYMNFNDTYKINMRVQTRYPGVPDMWFTGTVVKINPNGKSYAIQYDDGDYLPNVFHHQIRMYVDEDDEDYQDEEDEEEESEDDIDEY